MRRGKKRKKGKKETKKKIYYSLFLHVTININYLNKLWYSDVGNTDVPSQLHPSHIPSPLLTAPTKVLINLYKR